MMKRLRNIFLLTAICSLGLSCVETPSVEFGSEEKDIHVGPDASVQTIRIKSEQAWTAVVQVPWITVSPANGKGSAECKVMIDSALATTPREAKIFIDNLATGETLEFNVTQQGYEQVIKVSRPEIVLEDFAAFDKRYFEVEVEANVAFRLNIDATGTAWVEPKNIKDNTPVLNLDRGARPRKVKMRFDWKINSTESERETVINLDPIDPDVMIAEQNKDNIMLKQNAPEKIVEGVQGDSLALLAMSRTLGVWQEYDVNERMAHWDGVRVWKATETDDPKKVGRVRSASFYMFATKESLPFQVRYLTAAEELSFFGNTNTFLLNLDPGEDICKLTQLKRLTVSAYGLTSLPEEFRNLSNLRSLDISGNNFQSVPEVLCPENFPNLRTLIMNACQRQAINDLYMTKKENYGGFVDTYDTDEDGARTFPKRLLAWKNLDSLRLSFNFLQGTIPDLKDDPAFEKWTAEEVNACDTLPEILVGMPKVLPNTTYFAINHNRLHGSIPEWLLYHPNLDWWIPTSLVYPQEGITTYNVKAGFDNEPDDMDYYYKHYVNKKQNPANVANKK